MPESVTRLYAFGSNGSGQLGVGHFEDLSKPETCGFLESNNAHGHPPKLVARALHAQIKKIVAGGNHTLLLTTSGELYAAGENLDGRCGPLGPTEKAPIFARVALSDASSRVTDVAATWETSYIVLDNRRVLAFGGGCEAIAHLPNRDGHEIPADRTIFVTVFDTADLTSSEISSELVSISASMGHVLVVLSDGKVYGWGNCGKGQLGELPLKVRHISNPVNIKPSFDVTQIASGRDFTFMCSLDGQFEVLGRDQNFTRLKTSPEEPFGHVVSGWSTVFDLRNHHLRGWGRDDRGQLPPPDLPALRSFAAGSEHSIACTMEDLIITWGWGEHGNCGVPVDRRGNVVGRYNVIEGQLRASEKVAGVGAGCASSFFWTTQET